MVSRGGGGLVWDLSLGRQVGMIGTNPAFTRMDTGWRQFGWQIIVSDSERDGPVWNRRRVISYGISRDAISEPPRIGYHRGLGR